MSELETIAFKFLTDDLSGVKKSLYAELAAILERNKHILDFRDLGDGSLPLEVALEYWRLNQDQVDKYYAQETCRVCGSKVRSDQAVRAFETPQKLVLKQEGKMRKRWRELVFDSKMCQLRYFAWLMQDNEVAPDEK
jgi:hypothetical protein